MSVFSSGNIDAKCLDDAQKVGAEPCEFHTAYSVLGDAVRIGWWNYETGEKPIDRTAVASPEAAKEFAESILWAVENAERCRRNWPINQEYQK